MRKSVLVTLSLLVLFLSLLPTARQAFADDADDKVLANFVYAVPHLARVESNSGNNKICFYGYDQLTVSLTDQHHDAINITSVESGRLLGAGCGVLYVARDKDRLMKEISKVTDQIKIITVGLSDDFVDNGGVLSLQMGRRSVEVTTNRAKVKAFGIKFDPMMVNLVVSY